MITRLRRKMLLEVAERLRALSRSESPYLNLAQVVSLLDDAERLETLAYDLEDEV